MDNHIAFIYSNLNYLYRALQDLNMFWYFISVAKYCFRKGTYDFIMVSYCVLLAKKVLPKWYFYSQNVLRGTIIIPSTAIYRFLFLFHSEQCWSKCYIKSFQASVFVLLISLDIFVLGPPFRRICIRFRSMLGPPFTITFSLQSLDMPIIKCVMKLLIHSQISTVQSLEFGNG